MARILTSSEVRTLVGVTCWVSAAISLLFYTLLKDDNIV